MTEIKAKTKVCPYTFRDNPDELVANKCIASDCMAWRDLKRTELVGMKMESTGFCGLAGKL